jgi:hypothetical protein
VDSKQQTVVNGPFNAVRFLTAAWWKNILDRRFA